MKFEAIVFDYGNVLAGAPGPQKGFELVEKIGVPREDYFKAYFRYNKQVNRGEISWKELWTLVLTELGKMDRFPAVMAEVEEHEASLEKLNMNVVNLAVRLKQNGYKTGVISNTTPAFALRIRYNLAKYDFDVIHCSAETGLVKPDPAAFTDMAAALEVDIHNMVFIDDSERSLSTSEECGYTPVLFDNYEDLESKLRTLDIQI